MRWTRSFRADPRALPLANRHYNRQSPESAQFVAPGSCLVLLTPRARALWVTLWQRTEYTDHAWAGAWNNSLFRNEGAGLSSELIREAVAATRWHYGEPPTLGMLTFVDPAAIRSTNPGYCYLRAGFRRAGASASGKIALQLLPEDMPAAMAPYTPQLELIA